MTLAIPGKTFRKGQRAATLIEYAHRKRVLAVDAEGELARTRGPELRVAGDILDDRRYCAFGVERHGPYPGRNRESTGVGLRIVLDDGVVADPRTVEIERAAEPTWRARPKAPIFGAICRDGRRAGIHEYVRIFVLPLRPLLHAVIDCGVHR